VSQDRSDQVGPLASQVDGDGGPDTRAGNHRPSNPESVEQSSSVGCMDGNSVTWLAA
jgi:hypothetical protein